ncbi:MAG: glycosyltransferase [Actinobacteria bacterium]|nr:glycosyltransferase [Actinomycetota bacterium]
MINIFELIPVGQKSISDYSEFVGEEEITRLKALSSRLAGARVLNLSSTAFGGGVAELLHSTVPLMRDLGIDTEWQVVEGDEEFFTITKLLHNCLQGLNAPWEPEMVEVYLKKNHQYARSFSNGFDYIVVHDPQPVAMYPILLEDGHPGGKWVWRCHIDISEPKTEAWEFVKDYINAYDAAIFTSSAYAPTDLKIPESIMAPTIDPVSPKNSELGTEAVDFVLANYGVDTGRPVLLQVSRFDPWKDPLGVIDAYRIVKEKVPGVQLVFIASMAHDDPEGMHYYKVTAEKAEGDPDIHLLTNLEGIGNTGVNAFQRAADIVLQKSLKEGFGLTVSEALWKGRPVIAGNVGGIPLQIDNGENGYLVNSVEECADRILQLLDNPEIGKEMGRRGREKVRNKFLTPRELVDYIELFLSL